jgi:hypothetical protein
MVLVQGEASASLDVDTVLESLRRHCPGTELLDGDYGASRISRLAGMLGALGEATNSAVLESARATLRTLGVTRQIRIPLRGGWELVGTVRESGITLANQHELPQEALTPVLAALAEVPQLRGRVSVTGLECTAQHRPSQQFKKRAWWKFWQRGT